MIETQLSLIIDASVFSFSELEEAKKLAKDKDGKLYVWLSAGHTHCLVEYEKMTEDSKNRLGIVVLPRSMPIYIEMPDDDDPEQQSVIHEVL